MALRCRRYLSEGINDKHILKAIFTAGGSGSGKTYISDHMVRGLGLKVVNSDEPFERYLKGSGLPLVMKPDDPDVHATQLKLRATAKEKIEKSQSLWEEGMLGLLIDGTGANAEKVLAAKRRLEQLGYDTAMIYLRTPFSIAQSSNVRRGEQGGRAVDPKTAGDLWKRARRNLNLFLSAFGKENFFLIDRTETGILTGQEERSYTAQIRRMGMKWLGKPVQNPIGKAIIAKLKEVGGKTRKDLPQGFDTFPTSEDKDLRHRGYEI